jgi:DNA-entry nuclease
MDGMRPYEVQAVKYLDSCDNHVLYRVTPFYRGRELVPRGVEMEAWSVEDEGTGVCFHVFVHNVQPGIKIDYLTGMNWLDRSGGNELGDI